MRSTSHKDPLSEKSLKFLQSSKTYQMEMEFYEFTKNLFNNIMTASTTKDSDGNLQPIKNKIWEYFKIKAPK